MANVFFFFASWLLCGKFFFFKNYAVHDNFINKTMMLTSWSREWKNNWNTGNIFFFNTRWEYRAGRWILLLLYIYFFLIYHDSGKAISVEVNTFRGINTEQLTSIFFSRLWYIGIVIIFFLVCVSFYIFMKIHSPGMFDYRIIYKSCK